jgi:primosomal protein N' (replication factor Y)
MIDVLDSTLWPGPGLLDVVSFVADRYLCPPGVALRAVLLAGASLAPETRYIPGPVKPQDLEPKEASLARLIEQGPLTSREIARASGKGWLKALRSLLAREAVARRIVYAPRAGSVRRSGYQRTGTDTGRDTGRLEIAAAGDFMSSSLRPATLSQEQEAAVDAILGSGGAYLLFGVTGSGKTEVYMRTVEAQAENHGGAIVLIPEISLTPQTVRVFRERFGDRVAVLHSGLTQRERYSEWLRLHRGEARVAVGARSCVFAPVDDPSVIIIDEEHDKAYKQDQDPKYHVREVALRRSRTVVLGSATPSVESYYRAEKGEFHLLRMERRVAGAGLPECRIIDMREELRQGVRSIFCRSLVSALKETVARREQAILFLNRRGFSTFVLCRDCGYVVRCPWCDVSAVYHATENRLRCHYCNWSTKVPVTCPNCGSRQIRHFGAGTERVVEEVKTMVPEAGVLRMDADTTSMRGAFARILNAFRNHDADVLVGTQMVSKGHDLPGVTLVGIINADTALNLPDFRSAERTYQLIAQAAGRSGRRASPGQVIIQTYSPEHYAIQAAATLDYGSFYDAEIASRGDLGYPPCGVLLGVSVRGKSSEECQAAGESVTSLLAGSEVGRRIEVLGPAPCAVSRVKRVHRWQVLVKAPSLEDAKEAGRMIISQARRAQVSLDLDPETVM